MAVDGTFDPNLTGQIDIWGKNSWDYNIFKIMNIKNEKQISNIFKVLGAPFRIRLLYALGKGEACVCHLEGVLNRRQAYISQHLMVLRDAGILESRRDGKYIFYQVADQKIFDLITEVGAIVGVDDKSLPILEESKTMVSCSCPSCTEDLAAE